jgi:hypothetical protein
LGQAFKIAGRFARAAMALRAVFESQEDRRSLHQKVLNANCI